MQALNKALQKAEEPISICFSQVSYSQSGDFLTLLTEKTDVVELFKIRTNVFIQATKTVDEVVIEVEALEH